MDNKKKRWGCLPLVLMVFFLSCDPSLSIQAEGGGEIDYGSLVRKEERKIVVRTDNGVVSAVDVDDGYRGPYHLEFISLEPNSLFLPVLLHTDMVFYVQTGKGTISWTTEDDDDGEYKITQMDVERGDIHRIEMGSILYIRSQPDPMREKLRINALFGNMNDEERPETYIGTYSNVTDLFRGFDEEVLQMGFGVSKEVIWSLKGAEKPPPIIQIPQLNDTGRGEDLHLKEEFLEVSVGGRSLNIINKKMKKKKKKKFSTLKAYNIFEEKPDVENRYGWSKAVTKKDLKVLKKSNIGLFMVNLTKGSMMGPHWNPKATEIAVVTHGKGMVQIVYPTAAATGRNDQEPNVSMRLEEGDVFVVPRYHPMAQISFENESFVFMGFSTVAKENHPQYLAGSRSVFRVIDKEILALSFDVPNLTVDELFYSKDEAIMFDCDYCAEEVERRMEEEIERKREEEERRQEEEEKRRHEEEEERRRQEEEEKRRQEEEEARREEERQRQEEEEARREKEEERRRRQEEEEEEARREEERRRQEEEEEEARREEEERRRQEEEEKEEARREEEERRRQEEEEEEEKRRHEEEEEERRRQEEEEKRRQEEEEARREEERRQAEEMQRKEEEEARREEEEERRRRQEEEAEARREEERRRQEEEEEVRREEERRRQEEEEEARREEEERRRQEEEEEATREEEERRRREEEEVRREEEEKRRQEEEEEEERRRQEEERIRREEERQMQQEEEERRWKEEERREEQEERMRRQEEEEEEEERRRQQEEEEEEEEDRRESEEGGGGQWLRKFRVQRTMTV